MSRWVARGRAMGPSGIGASTSKPGRAGEYDLQLDLSQGTVTFSGAGLGMSKERLLGTSCCRRSFHRWDSGLGQRTLSVRQALEPSSLSQRPRIVPAHTHTYTLPRYSDLSMSCRNFLLIHTQLIGVGHLQCAKYWPSWWRHNNEKNRFFKKVLSRRANY